MSSRQDAITPLRITVRDLKASFESLVNAERALGFNETQGTTADLIGASDEIEKTIDNELTWVGDRNSAKLMGSLLTMRHYEVEYRLSQLASRCNRRCIRQRPPPSSTPRRGRAPQHRLQFGRGPPATKQKLNKAVQPYSYAFAQWVANADKIEPLLTLIDHDTESVLPEPIKSSPPLGRMPTSPRAVSPPRAHDPVDHRLGRIHLRHAVAVRRLAIGRSVTRRSKAWPR